MWKLTEDQLDVAELSRPRRTGSLTGRFASGGFDSVLRFVSGALQDVADTLVGDSALASLTPLYRVGIRTHPSDERGPERGPFGPEVGSIGAAFSELQMAREWADYSPEPHPSPATADGAPSLALRRSRLWPQRAPPCNWKAWTRDEATLATHWSRDQKRTDDEIHPLLAQGPSRHLGLARRDRRDADPHRPRGRGRRGPGAKYEGFVVARVIEAEPASERRPAARLHRRRRRRAGAGRLRRAQRAHRHEERVLAGRDLHSRQEDHPRQGRHPRRRVERHAVLGGRARALRRSRRHHRSARRRAGRRRLRALTPGSTIPSSTST